MKVLLFGSLLFLAAALTADEPLVVHEWGTFTSLQDETGQAIAGINTDDEPVPHFVHNLAGLLLIPPTQVPAIFFQGAPRCHPDVTMRLETPVMYFHLPKSVVKPQMLDVNVEFRGGWLTQFYPAANAVAPGVQQWPNFGPLRSDTIGKLSWPSLKVGGDQAGPMTDERVWTSPRAVSAASVTTTNGESEKFLFYRGVGHLDAPLRVVRDDSGGELVVSANHKPPMIDWLYLADIRRDGTVAFRQLQPTMLKSDAMTIVATTSATFQSGDYSADNMAQFRGIMRDELVQAGLFSDEAEALLNTWELSYFKSPGLRLFFIVPREWTDTFLPLHLSVPAQVTRVMVGRIELVTPDQRQLLRKIAGGPAFDVEKFLQALSASRTQADQNAWNRIWAGRAPIASVGIPVPAIYQAYLDLGRFRNALVLDEQRHHPTSALTEFIRINRLESYKIPPA